MSVLAILFIFQVLEMLPEDTKIEKIKDFLMTVLQERTVHQRKLHLLMNLMITEHLQVNIHVMNHACSTCTCTCSSCGDV